MDKVQLNKYSDISYAGIKRARVWGLILNGPLNKVELMLAGHDALAFASKYLPDIQGLALFLWNDREKVGKEEATVSIEWCPRGKWGQIGHAPITENIFTIEFDHQGEEDGEQDIQDKS